MGVKVGASEVGVYLGAEKLAGVGGGTLVKTETPFTHSIESAGFRTFTVDIEDASATLNTVALNDIVVAWKGTSVATEQMSVTCKITNVENGIVTISANWAWSTGGQNVTVTGKILNFKVG